MNESKQKSFWDKIVLPSTRAYWREAKERKNGSLLETVHGYAYLRWPYLYISLGMGRHPLARFLRAPLYRMGKWLGLWKKDGGKSFADSYHGKVMPPDNARRLIRINRPLKMDLPETVLPYDKAREIILEHPGDIAVFQCPCRASMPSPCMPLEVCLIVGKTFTDFVLEHLPHKSRRVTVDEASEILHQCHMRGNVSHAFFKEAVLGRYYAICNCCSCCCGAMQAQAMGIPMLASSGYVAGVKESACTGCGLCVKRCHFKAVRMGSRGIVEKAGGNGVRRQRVKPVAVIDREKCMGCGICVLHCKAGALDMEIDPAKPSPLEV